MIPKTKSEIVNSKVNSFSLKLLAFLSFMLLFLNLIGCSPSNNDAGFLRTSETSDNSSRLSIPDSQASAPKDVALCNKLQDPLITFQLMVFYDQYKSYHPEFIRLYIPQINAEFEKSNYQLVLRKWKANTNGETYQDDTPLKLWAERKIDKAPATEVMDALQWDLLSANLQKAVGTIFTMTDAFKKFNFVVDLKDPSGTFDVLKISLYKDEEWITDWNLLIPAFYAHPTTYASNQNSVLAKLHPFYGQENSSFGAEFATQLNSYCF